MKFVVTVTDPASIVSYAKVWMMILLFLMRSK